MKLHDREFALTVQLWSEKEDSSHERCAALQNYSRLTATDKSFLVLANQVRSEPAHATLM